MQPATQVADLLTADRIAVPMQVADLAGALRALVGRLEASGGIEAGDVGDLVEDLTTGSDAERIRLNESVFLVAGRTNGVVDLSIGLGIAPIAFELPDAEDPDRSARAILLLLTPRRLSTLRIQVIPSLSRVLRDEDRTLRLLSARSPSDVRAMSELMEVELHERLLVEDAHEPLSYRVYPDTPAGEVMDLMVRRRLDSVPVVSDKYEFLGIITSAEALKHLLPRRVAGEGDEVEDHTESSETARDIMSRSVMCVSEDQSLIEAANLMVNKDVARLPVVREGELIGVITRDAILQTLFGK